MAERDPLIELLALGAAGLALIAWQATKEKRSALQATSQPPRPEDDQLDEDLALARAIRAAIAEAQPEPPPEPSVASFDVSAVGNNVVLAGAPGYRIAVYDLTLYNTVQQNIELRDAEKTLLALPGFPAQAGYQLGMQEQPHFVLGYGNSLIIKLSAGRVTGFIRYRMLERWGN